MMGEVHSLEERGCCPHLSVYEHWKCNTHSTLIFSALNAWCIAYKWDVKDFTPKQYYTADGVPCENTTHVARLIGVRDNISTIMKKSVVRTVNISPFFTLMRAQGEQAVLLDHLQRLMGGCCLLYTSPSPRDRTRSRMPSSA